jgi:uncharacterized protein (TIGR03067 family)
MSVRNGPAPTRLVFQGDRVSSYDAGKLVEVNLFFLQAGKKPRVMWLTQVKGNEPGLSQQAIYDFTGERFRLCANRKSGGPLPTEFKTQPGSGVELFELRRVAEKKKP